MNTLRRIAPAACLVLLAPLVAEFLLGNLPVTLLGAMVLLAPMYGGGALLIREVTRRAGRGVPTMLGLGVAYGLLEEGVSTQSLFNPHYAGGGLLGAGYLPALGIAAPWTLFVLTLHAVNSITVPIVVVELCTPARRTTPWLGRPGLGVAAALFVLGLGANAALQLLMDPFRATPAQFAAVAVTAAVVVVVALRLPRRNGAEGPAPAPWLVGTAVLVVAGLTQLLPLTWPSFALVALVEVALGLLAARWTTRTAWTPRHSLAAAAAVLLTYAWHSFPETPVVPVAPAVDLIGNAIFTLGALALVALAWRRTAPEALIPAGT